MSALSLWTGIPCNPLQPVSRAELAKVNQIVVAVREDFEEWAPARPEPQPAPEWRYSLVPGRGSSTTTAVSVGRRDA